MAIGKRHAEPGRGDRHPDPRIDPEAAHAPGRARPRRFLSEVPTPHGPASVAYERPAGPVRSLLVLGHGAGGSVDAPDLLAVRDAALAAHVAVARVTQPYRVAGRRTPPRAPVLDETWVAVLATLPEHGALVVGGRSSGARVACRTATTVGAQGVLALAFPLHPPGRPSVSRDDELRSGVETLVVNGDRDPFGVPAPSPGIEVVVRPGERHDLRRDPAGTAAVVLAWLARHGWADPSL